MKTLIIPDIHQRQHVAEHIISHEKPDKIIFLGDYFDSYIECPDDVRETAKWLKWSIREPNRVHCLGNHDVPYWFPRNKYLNCPGFNQFKLMLTQEHLTFSDWSKCVFFHNLDDKWLLSHAGAHPGWVSKQYRSVGRYSTDIQTLCKQLEKDTSEFLVNAGRNEAHWFAAWSRARSGTNYPGGLLWNDFHGDFHAIVGVNQLVGHTHDERPRWVYLKKDDPRQSWYGDIGLTCHYGPDISYNLCLDTGLQHYGVWNGTKLNIKLTSDLIKKQLVGKNNS